MGQAIGQSLPLAIGIALSPIPIIAVVLMLGTPRGAHNGPAFLLGWVVGLTILGTIVLLASGAFGSADAERADWVNWLYLLLGLVLIRTAVRNWRKRPHGDDDKREMPSWMKSIDHFTPGKSISMGVALSAINPKNAILMISGAAAISATGISAGEQAAAMALFILVATLGAGVPVAIYFLMKERAKPILADLQAWMTRNNNVIIAVICLLIAAKLIGDAISGLTA